MGAGATSWPVRFRKVTQAMGNFVGVRDLDLAGRRQGVSRVCSARRAAARRRRCAWWPGLEEPTDGEIWIGDELVNEMPPRERDVAMVFQNYGLYPHMTVRDNIGYPLKVRGIPKDEARRQIDAAAAKVELGPYLDRKPGQLSGGQRQRVALARSLVRTPRVFLMDEPLSNLDAKLRVTMRAELKHLHHELRITTIYVTHDQMEAMTLATRVAVMNKGVIQQLAPPEAIYNDPANMFVAGFIGSPSMNLMRRRSRSTASFGPRTSACPAWQAAQAARGSCSGSVPRTCGGSARQPAILNAPVYAFELTGEACW